MLANRLIMHWIHYLLCVTIIVASGICLEIGIYQYAEIPPNSFTSISYNFNEHLSDVNKLPILQPVIKVSTPEKPKNYTFEPLESVQAIEKIKSKEIILPKAESPNKPNYLVKSDSGLVESHIEEILKGTSLAGHDLAKAILEIEEKYGINAYFTIAVMKLESGNGKSRIAQDKNNLFGLNALDGDSFNKAFSFKTMGDSVEKFGQLISDNYIDKGYKTIEKVSTKYCQANPKWAGVVKGIMENDYSKAVALDKNQLNRVS
jgi:beta-N-acetylglucosaminidase